MQGVDEIISHASRLFGTIVDFNIGSHQSIIGAALARDRSSCSAGQKGISGEISLSRIEE
jgi:hypothetical protein